MKNLLCTAVMVLSLLSCTYTSKMSYYRQTQPAVYSSSPQVLHSPNVYTYQNMYYNNSVSPSNSISNVPVYYTEPPRQNQTGQFLLGAVTGYLVNDITHRIGNNYQYRGYGYQQYRRPSYQYQSPYYKPWSPPPHYTPWMSSFGTHFNRGHNQVYSDIYRGYMNGYGQVVNGYYNTR